MIDSVSLWIVIIGLGIGSFSLRFVFLGLIGDRPIPEWILRHLRYTAVAIIPALVAPLVMMPTATDGEFDIPRFLAAAVALLVGYFTKNVIWSMVAGGLTLYPLLYLLG
ncbi:MAG: AzlD domain-containing protein [Paracoccaceae bacterium]|nr:AzlD domain-containing protein [Paracoccaceae bacterium]MDG1736344.1 AzlD domain-containing protein [Paracoccaceae bacterium]MDG2258830.1 AzlD domain-containing protein [Paracoccaceae bacterium]